LRKQREERGERKQRKMGSKKQKYEEMAEGIKGLLEGSRHWVTNTANVSALVFHSLLSHGTPVNWVGFYLRSPSPSSDPLKEDLFLGPFQGEVACVAIPQGKGVCGGAAQARKTLVLFPFPLTFLPCAFIYAFSLMLSLLFSLCFPLCFPLRFPLRFLSFPFSLPFLLLLLSVLDVVVFLQVGCS